MMLLLLRKKRITIIKDVNSRSKQVNKFDGLLIHLNMIWKLIMENSSKDFKFCVEDTSWHSDGEGRHVIDYCFFSFV